MPTSSASRRPRLGLSSPLLAIALIALAAVPAMAAAKPKPASIQKVTTLKGFAAPGTPAALNKVKVLKQGDPKADHVLVLIPGTSGGAAYFRPLGKALVKEMPDYQVWSIDRRENLLEDHSMLDKALAGDIDVKTLFDYYLGWIGDPYARDHFNPVADSTVPFARDWGMNVAVRDLRTVIKKAGKKGRSVVLGGHSLGGSVATAYATWDFGGKPGAKGLDGLVFIDGGSLGGTPPTSEEARASLDNLQKSSPFLDLLGAGLPWSAGVFNAVGSSAAIMEPNAPSVAQSFPLLPSSLKPPVPASNAGQYGYSFDADTSPASLALIHVHIGQLASSGDPRGWDDGELGTVARTADAFRGIKGIDGTEWYFPKRLSIDSSAVNNGIKNPAQKVFGDKAIHGRDVHVPMYAFQTSLGYAGGANRVIDATKQLAKQSHVKKKDLRLVSKPKTYAHIDPLTATPKKNAFLKNLVKFLTKQVG